MSCHFCLEPCLSAAAVLQQAGSIQASQADGNTLYTVNWPQPAATDKRMSLSSDHSARETTLGGVLPVATAGAAPAAAAAADTQVCF